MLLLFPDLLSARRPLRIQTGEEILIRQTIRISDIFFLFPSCLGCLHIPEGKLTGSLRAVCDRLANCPRLNVLLQKR